MPIRYGLHSINPIMKARYLFVKMRSVSASIVAHALNLSLKTLQPARLLPNAVTQSPHGLRESIHLISQVIESHIQVVPQVRRVIIVHPLGCRFGSIRSPSHMNRHPIHALISLLLLPLQSTCETSNQCSQ